MKVITRIVITAAFLAAAACGPAPGDTATTCPADLVSPLMGTDSEYLLSHGNTYPAVALPWGMNFWTPQTRRNGDGWAYTYDDHRIVGIKQTHQPSPWINDYAAFSLMPVAGGTRITEEERASWFSHKSEVSHPYLYSVYLADWDITAEVTPTERSSIFRFTFPESDSSAVVIDAYPGGSMVRFIPEKNRVIGYCRNNHGGVPDNFHNWFVIEFDREFDFFSSWVDGMLTAGAIGGEGGHAVAVAGFRTQRGDTVTARVASSFISPEQALLNLERETGGRDFDAVCSAARERWNSELGRIKVEGGDDDMTRTFYSALYRTLLFPRMFYEYDRDSAIVHYSPYNGQVLPGRLFTDNGFWDTFRAAMPLLTLLYPEKSSHIMEGLVNTYLESGWLPEWASPGHRDCMIGSNSASIIADAYLKGIRGYEIDTLWQALVKNTGGHGPVHSVGRYGAEYYNSLGYVPYDAGINENVARTLEYAYADWCLWRLATELGRPQEEADLYLQRSQNYRNVFDTERKLMRGKNLDGTFQSPFSPYKWGDAFTEGNSWHYTWSVFHDVAGLADLMGGTEMMARMLDSVFIVPPLFDDSYYGFPIHEIREMQVMKMGNYAHGNQPVQHMIYLYNYTPEPWKAQMRVREVMDKLYNYTPDGYCGDEDNGQTSAWYVFSALGFYPVAPGTGEYVLGSPLFRKATITLDDGRELVITAPENGRENVFVDAVTLNRKMLDVNYVTHSQLKAGGTLEFRMSSLPDKERGASPGSYPYSFSSNKESQ
ncbi:MAG: GH92 family glycosyl hydrolase [Bacteroidales bacterium]|nr:GH92 family glycosyl hydrolase [Bacteroidales bacterium]MDT8374288.1 GH92 family glycosyl hydrolase [Bacteroidales bacterium]